jgi:DNA-binding protein HU-beta
MNKDAIIRKVASRLDLQYKVVKDVAELLFDTITDSLLAEEPVNIVGFGTFDIKTRSSRKGRNPQTGEEIILPQSSRPYFKPGRSLNRIVKRREK